MMSCNPFQCRVNEMQRHHTHTQSGKPANLMAQGSFSGGQRYAGAHRHVGELRQRFSLGKLDVGAWHLPLLPCSRTGFRNLWLSGKGCLNGLQQHIGLATVVLICLASDCVETSAKLRRRRGNKCKIEQWRRAEAVRTAGEAEDVRIGHGGALQQPAVRADLQQTSKLLTVVDPATGSNNAGFNDSCPAG